MALNSMYRGSPAESYTHTHTQIINTLQCTNSYTVLLYTLHVLKKCSAKSNLEENLSFIFSDWWSRSPVNQEVGGSRKHVGAEISASMYECKQMRHKNQCMY